MAADEDSLTTLLQSLSHPLRRMILNILESRNNATFSELLFRCGLDTYYQKGLLDYHLKNLNEAGVVTKIDKHYMLSGMGRKVVGFFDEISREHRGFLVSRKERRQKGLSGTSAGGEKKMEISVVKIPKADLVVDSYIFPVGEKRKYHRKLFPSESPFKMTGRCVSEECLKETRQNGEECKVIEYRYYNPGNKNKSLDFGAEEGFLLYGWCKVHKLVKNDGVFQLRDVYWDVRDPSEFHNVYDPPYVESRFPLKAGLTGKETVPLPQEKGVTTVVGWNVEGDYEARVGSNIYECLLKRELYTHFLKDRKHPTAPEYVIDWYCAKGLLNVVFRRWDELDWMKEVGYKEWEECPTMRWKNRIWYLTEERYLTGIMSA